MSAIDDAVRRGRVRTVDGRLHWLDVAAAGPDGVAGTFRQVDGGCIFHVPALPTTVAATRTRDCAVHATLGHQALPASCQHFPRVCLIDGRGVRVSLSHYCPTAAAMIVDGDGPVTIVAGPPAVAGRAVPEGLDVRDGLPPRLTDRVLADLDGITAWEAHVVATLAGIAPASTPERGLATLGADAAGLAAWSPAASGSLADAVADLGARRSTTDLARAEAVLANALTWPPWFELAARTCRAPWLAAEPPDGLADLDARYVVPSWEGHAPAVRRYLAARAFGSWIAYQADVAATIARWLTLCHAVLRVECARSCGAVGRRLDRGLLVEAIRRSDLLLVHYADSLAMAKTLGGRGIGHPAPEAGPGPGYGNFRLDNSRSGS